MFAGLSKDIYFIVLSRFILGLGNFTIPFIVLLLTQKLGLSPSVSGIWYLVSGIWVMIIIGTYMLGGLLGGKLSDHFDH